MKKTLSEAQLSTLLESMKLINSTLDLDELLTIVMREITEKLKADRGTLYIVDEQNNEIWSKIAQGDRQLEIRQPIGKGISGHVAQTGEVINISDAYQDRRFNPDFDKKSGYRTRSVLCMPVLDKTDRIIAVLQILNKKNGRFTAKDEVFTSVFSDYIALAIQNAQLYQEALERKKLEDEITVAGEIQKMLLPSCLPRLDEYEIYVFHHPSRHIGGDYYDFFPVENSLKFILADVSGKGTPAALLMANMQATIHSLVAKCTSNLDLVNSFNRYLFSITASDKYATMVWGDLILDSNEFKYIVAGHIPPLLFTHHPKKIEVSQLPLGSIPVGFLQEFDFQEGSLRLKPADLLLICSDGVTEAQNKQEEMFETDRLKEIVINNYAKDLTTIGTEIISQVNAFAKNGAYDDDITLLMIRRMKK